MDNENIKKAVDRFEKPLIFKDAKILKMDKGDVLLELPIMEENMNYKGELHGGIIFTLADYCSGMASLSLGCKVTTLQASMNYVKAGHIGPVYARSKIIHKGRTTHVFDIEISDGNNETIANGTYTMFVLEYI